MAAPRTKSSNPKPKPKPAPKPKAAQAKPAGAPVLVTPGWTGIESIAVGADGRVFAGENGRARVCCWDADGTLAWQTELQYPGDRLGVKVQRLPEMLLVHVGSRAFYLDAATGAVTKTIGTPEYTRTLAISPDGSRLVVRTSTNAKVFALPAFTEVATLEEYCNEDPIAFSDDSAYFAINGHEVHVYETATAAHRVTFEPPDSPNAMIFDRTGAIVTGDGAARIGRYDVRGALLSELDTSQPRKGKPTITALAASATHLAVAQQTKPGGTVVVYDHAGTLVATFTGHALELPGSGRDLPGLAWSADGARLYVGAARIGEPVGVTVYSVAG